MPEEKPFLPLVSFPPIFIDTEDDEPEIYLGRYERRDAHRADLDDFWPDKTTAELDAFWSGVSGDPNIEMTVNSRRLPPDDGPQP